MVILQLAFANAVAAQQDTQANWPRFRGSDGNGSVSDDPRLPDQWNTENNVAWKVDVPGSSCSSPIVWGDRVFVTSVVSEEKNTQPKAGLYLGQGVRVPAKGTHHWMVHCFDLKTGKEIWKHEAHTGKPAIPRHPKSSYAAETPTTDGERVYVLFGDVGLYCYDLDGKQLWANPIEAKRTFFDYGAASSPVVHQGQVIVVYDNLEQSWIASVDAKTGKEKWRTEREENKSWATPMVWINNVRTEIVVPGVSRNRSYGLDGKLLWHFKGRMSSLVIPSPMVAHGMCYVGSGYIGDGHRPTFAIKPGGSGNLVENNKFAENEFIEWYLPQGSAYNTSQIIVGDYLYTVHDRGFMTCHNALTGEEVYGKQRFSPRGSFTASPWAYNGKIFCLSEKGLTYVVEQGPKFKIERTNDLEEFCMSTPAIADGRLLIRTKGKLYCLTNASESLR